MARVAFVMDKLLRKIGLSGRSFVPMLVGFGCSVPAIMATRTLSSNRDRKMTILLTPFMSCSAKIPIYTLFAAAFFPGHELLVMLALYFGGILVGILVALVLKNTAFKGNPVPFVMELPNYRFPSAKSVVLLMWEKAKDFLTRAFTVIFMATVIIWFMQTFDTRLNVVENSADSILAALGRLVSPIFAPLGFGDWRMVHGAGVRLHREGSGGQHFRRDSGRQHGTAWHCAALPVYNGVGGELPCLLPAVHPLCGGGFHH